MSLFNFKLKKDKVEIEELIQYETNGWPIFSIDINQVKNNSLNYEILIKVPIKTNFEHLIFLETSTSSRDLNQIISNDKLLNNNDEWSKEIKLEFPIIAENNAKNFISNYCKIKYVSYNKNEIISKITNRYLDNLFGNIKNRDFFNGNKFNINYLKTKKIVFGNLYDSNFSLISNSIAFNDEDSIVFYANNFLPVVNSNFQFTENIFGTKFQFDLQNNLATKNLNSQGLIFDKKKVVENSNSLNIPLVSNNAEIIKSKESALFICLSKTEFKKIQLLSHSIQLNEKNITIKENISTGQTLYEDINGDKYYKYTLAINGLGDGGDNQIYSISDLSQQIDDDVLLYSIDNLIFSSKSFFENKFKEIEIPFSTPPDYDLFTISSPNFDTIYKIATYFKSISNSKTLEASKIIELNKKLNNSFDETKLKDGDKIYLPKGYLQLMSQIGNDKTTNKIRIAWTFDDGPTTKTTDELIEVLNEFNISKVTYFIMRNKLNTNKNYVHKYKELIAKGAEIGIHSVSNTTTSDEHKLWFPALSSAPFKSYSSIKSAMDDLEAFYKELKDLNIPVFFVRPPTGLKSEVLNYLKYLNFNGDDDKKRIFANDIIKQNYNSNPIYQTVVNDINNMKSRLTQLNLKLGVTWPKLTNQDWDAESSGGTLTDNITNHNKVNQKGVFEKMVDDIYKGAPSKYLVILAHDTKTENIPEIKNDILQMEYYASYVGHILKGNLKPRFDLEPKYKSNTLPKKDGIEIEYHTMSSLYSIIN